MRELLEETAARERVPGLALVVARGAGAPNTTCVGVDGQERPLEANSLFPVASLTKLATALTVLRLVDEGELGLDDALADRLPGAAAAAEGVTIRRLLSHSAGLPGELGRDVAPYNRELSWQRLAEACLATPVERAPGTYVQYSNPGYGLLALVVERLLGHGFEEAVRTLVLAPLGIEGSLRAETPREPAWMAGARSSHVGTEIEPYNSAFWRGLALPWGGLVTTPVGGLALARAFAGVPSGFLREETRREALRNQNGDLGGGPYRPLIWHPCPWGLGAELRGRKTPHWAPIEAAESSFGHAGASGCYAWVDPARDVAWALYGTRTMEGGWLLRAGPSVGAAVLGALT